MTLHLPAPLSASQWCNEQRLLQKSIGYVPTMGALHPGHLSLIEQAQRENDVCCVSIFVNPLQFNDPDDLIGYPSNLDNDIRLLESAGCHMVYTGTLGEFFPEVEDIHQIDSCDPGPAAKGLEGNYRPGHLQGVYQIVERLFTTVGDCRAYFGEKDFQQTLVVKNLAEKMQQTGTNVEVIVCPTVREPSGLAMSSRNTKLGDAHSCTAALIYKALGKAKSAWQQGIRVAEKLEDIMLDTLQHPDLKVEYAAVRDPNGWTENSPDYPLKQAQALIAAHLGGVRLIDNLCLSDDLLE